MGDVELTNIEDIKTMLNKIARKINKIEDDVVDFTKDAEWIKLRKHQNVLYIRLEQIKKLEEQNEQIYKK